MLESQSVEQHGLLHGAVLPVEAEAEPGTATVVCMCNDTSHSYSPLHEIVLMWKWFNMQVLLFVKKQDLSEVSVKLL